MASHPWLIGASNSSKDKDSDCASLSSIEQDGSFFEGEQMYDGSDDDDGSDDKGDSDNDSADDEGDDGDDEGDYGDGDSDGDNDEHEQATCSEKIEPNSAKQSGLASEQGYTNEHHWQGERQGVPNSKEQSVSIIVFWVPLGADLHTYFLQRRVGDLNQLIQSERLMRR